MVPEPGISVKHPQLGVRNSAQSSANDEQGAGMVLELADEQSVLTIETKAGLYQ